MSSINLEIKRELDKEKQGKTLMAKMPKINYYHQQSIDNCD